MNQKNLKRLAIFSLAALILSIISGIFAEIGFLILSINIFLFIPVGALCMVVALLLFFTPLIFLIMNSVHCSEIGIGEAIDKLYEKFLLSFGKKSSSSDKI